MNLWQKSLNLWPSWIGLLLLLFFFTNILAQPSDSLKKVEPLKNSEPKHSSKVAALMSAIVPGIGQVYNKKYWKVPLIYGGFAILGYEFKLNHDKYNTYLGVYRNRMNGDSTDVYNKYTNENLKTLINAYHRYRDLYAICFTGLYLLNIIDASVDAHLFTFDVSDKLSLNIQPFINPPSYSSPPPIGMTLTCHFLK